MPLRRYHSRGFDPRFLQRCMDKLEALRLERASERKQRALKLRLARKRRYEEMLNEEKER